MKWFCSKKTEDHFHDQKYSVTIRQVLGISHHMIGSSPHIFLRNSQVGKGHDGPSAQNVWSTLSLASHLETTRMPCQRCSIQLGLLSEGDRAVSWLQHKWEITSVVTNERDAGFYRRTHQTISLLLIKLPNAWRIENKSSSKSSTALFLSKSSWILKLGL